MANPYAGMGSIKGKSTRQKNASPKDARDVTKGGPPSYTQKPGKAPTKRGQTDMNKNAAPKTKNEAAPFGGSAVSAPPLTLKDVGNSKHTITTGRLKKLGY